MLWSKQLYCFDIPEWVRGDPLQPEPPRSRRQGRNGDRLHLNNADIVSMPDKWEYPWHAAWDLAFHCATLALVDLDFAKDQLLLLTRDWHMHPNGQLRMNGCQPAGACLGGLAGLSARSRAEAGTEIGTFSGASLTT